MYPEKKWQVQQLVTGKAIQQQLPHQGRPPRWPSG